MSQTAGEVHQKYTIVTFDLAVAKKAYSIVWQNPQQFNNVMVQLGMFHTTCGFLAAFRKQMGSSGLEEIFIESGIYASGSIAKVMSGKHYNRAMRVRKIMLEALEQKLMKKYEDMGNILLKSEAKDVMECLAKDPSEQTLKEVLQDEDSQEMTSMYDAFKDQVIRGEHGKTPQFWIGYMDKVILILICCSLHVVFIELAEITSRSRESIASWFGH